MSPLDRPITLTLFPDATAFQKQEASISLRDLAPKIKAKNATDKSLLPWLKCATFGELKTHKGSLRNKANMLSITGIEGDYDGCRMTPEAACELLRKAEIAAMVYTSPSHMFDLPKWRIVCPFSNPITACSPEQLAQIRREHTGRVNAVLGGILAHESFTSSQSYYFGSVNNNADHQVFLVDGE